MAIIKLPRGLLRKMSQEPSWSLIESTASSQPNLVERGEEVTGPRSNDRGKAPMVINAEPVEEQPPVERVHVLSSYELVYRHMCTTCDQRFRFKKQLAEHVKTTHGPKKRGRPLKPRRQPQPPQIVPEHEPLPQPPRARRSQRQRRRAPAQRMIPYRTINQYGVQFGHGYPPIDLSLGVGIGKVYRGKRRGLPSLRKPAGPSRVFMWFKDYAMSLNLALHREGRVGALLKQAGSVANIVRFCQTLSDEELELKLGQF